jgi:hypothetical protein
MGAGHSMLVALWRTRHSEMAIHQKGAEPVYPVRARRPLMQKAWRYGGPPTGAKLVYAFPMSTAGRQPQRGLGRILGGR